MNNGIVQLDGPPIARIVVRANKKQVEILQEAYSRTSGLPDCDVLRQLHAETGLAEKWIVNWFRRFRKKEEKTKVKTETHTTHTMESAEGEAREGSAAEESKPKRKSKNSKKKPKANNALVIVKAEIGDSVIPPGSPAATTPPPAPLTSKYNTSVKIQSPTQIVFPTSFNVTVPKHEHTEPFLSNQAANISSQRQLLHFQVAPFNSRNSRASALFQDLANIAALDEASPKRQHHASTWNDASQSQKKRSYPDAQFIHHTPNLPDTKRPRIKQTSISESLPTSLPMYPSSSSVVPFASQDFPPAMQYPSLPVSQPYTLVSPQVFPSNINTPNTVSTFDWRIDPYADIAFRLEMPQVSRSYQQQNSSHNREYHDIVSSGSRSSNPTQHRLVPPPQLSHSSSYPVKHSERVADPLDPSLCPLKHLRVLDELLRPAENDCTAVFPDFDAVLDRLLDEKLVETDPFQASMGLVFLSRLGYRWD